MHLKGERLYNKEGVYETDVDHLAEIYKNLYHKVGCKIITIHHFM